MKSDPTTPQSKPIAVLGAGESGVAAAKLLSAEGRRVCVLDTAPEAALQQKSAELRQAGIALECGEGAVTCLKPGAFAFAVLSPGIDPSSALVRAAEAAKLEWIGELELAFQRCQCPVVAITGTNGKTTTTQLIDRMFNAAGVPSVACGNIGPAFSAKVSESSQLRVMTVETSSFQLESIETFRPRIAVWLNFAPDHLDRYRSMEEYFEAKCQIFKNATPEDWAVVNARDRLPPIASRVIRFSAYEECPDFDVVGEVIRFRGEPVLDMRESQLRGLHNAENLMAALGVGWAWGLTWDSMREALCGYRALPHRCEWVGEWNGVSFVNDSKATNLDALEKALMSEKRRVVLIAGGKDKGFEFGDVTELVAARCKEVVLIGEMAGRIEALWASRIRCHRAPDLHAAVECAAQLAEAGEVVLFSPGTSSFDMFRNYADRGNQFRDLVRRMMDQRAAATFTGGLDRDAEQHPEAQTQTLSTTPPLTSPNP